VAYMTSCMALRPNIFPGKGPLAAKSVLVDFRSVLHVISSGSLLSAILSWLGY
jgi:hypothetical protein